ncbi:MAG: 30S ribosomal protein S16 [Oligoflexales bacterium]|nr:30S ribosomal protein S16 [Oligoflexales bacterium]
MSVKIRLQRKGKIHSPFYHIVATDSRCARNGKFIEKIGYYDPREDPSVIEVKSDRVQYWYGKGAQLSDCVKNLLKIKNLKVTRENTAKK